MPSEMKERVLRQIAEEELAGITHTPAVTPAEKYDRFRRRLLQRVFYGEARFAGSTCPHWVPPPPKRWAALSPSRCSSILSGVMPSGPQPAAASGWGALRCRPRLAGT
jgi:hypothetical protein